MRNRWCHPDLVLTSQSGQQYASNYINGHITLTWEQEILNSDPFSLAFDGNPYNAMIFVLSGSNNFEDGDLIAIYDGELCVGKGTWPLENKELVASQDDGSGNGFTIGHKAIFKVWRNNILYDLTPITTKRFKSMAVVEDLVLSITPDTYIVYRNGNQLDSGISSLSYVDGKVESEMTYEYRVSAVNKLESNPSDPVTKNTLTVNGNPPVLAVIADQEVSEDNSLVLTLSATDADKDSIIYFARPVIVILWHVSLMVIC